VTITWTTDTPATSQVKYGTSTAYGSSTTLDSTLVTSHSQSITGLQSGTLYNYQVISSNGAGTTTSANYTFNTTGTNAAGQWGAIMSWPLVAVHMNLLPNGKLLLWDAWQTPTPAQVWDPGSQTFTTVNNSSGLFCAGEVQLADGRLLVAGGHDQSTGFTESGIKATNIFDPATNTWTRVADMNFSRWYPSLTLLPDGRVLAISGQSTPGSFVDTPEVYSPATNTWTTLNISTSQLHEPEYPLAYLQPSGKVLVIAGKAAQSFLLDVNAQTWGPVGGTTLANGSAAMYLPGKILYTGGGDISSTSNPAQTSAQVLDATAASPAWQSVSAMAFPRYEHSLVNLPDGTVFIMGGATTTSQTTTSDTLQTEIWNPATMAFTTTASQAEGRIYHSTASLMPDGRVLVAGGGRFNNAVDHFSAQYFSPPYLFKGARPSITNAPATGAYGSPVTVTTPDSANIASVSLINLAAHTHTTDMDQREVPLSFTAGSGSLSVSLPATANQAPPGYYMLFIVNSAGVPSTASMIKLGGSAPADTQPPTVSMTAPAAGATVSGTAVPVSANATDNVAVANVQFLLDGNPLGSPVTSAPYQLSWDSTQAANGSHQLSATAVDTSGNKATSAPVTVTVSNAASAGPTADGRVSVHAKGPATTPGLSTTKAGDVLLAFASSDGPSSGQTVTVSGGGVTWSLVSRANGQPGSAEVWKATASSVLSGATFTATPSITGYNVALTVQAFSGASGVGSSVAAGGKSAPSVSLTTTGASSLVAGAGFDWDNGIGRTVGPGQNLLDQWVNSSTGDTFWSQITSAPIAAAGTTVTINDSAPTGDRWDLAAAEVLAAPTPASPAAVLVSYRTRDASSSGSSTVIPKPADRTSGRLVYRCSFGSVHGPFEALVQRGPQWPANPVGRGRMPRSRPTRTSLPLGGLATWVLDLPYHHVSAPRSIRALADQQSSSWPRMALVALFLPAILVPVTRRRMPTWAA
jgi:hypothetical protein